MQKLATMSEQKNILLPDLPAKDLFKVEPLKISRDFNLHLDLLTAYGPSGFEGDAAAGRRGSGRST